MFITRLLSGILLVILALFFCISGGDLLFVLCLALSLAALFELQRVLKLDQTLFAGLNYASVLVYYALLRLGLGSYLMGWAALTLILLMSIYVFTFPKYTERPVCESLLAVFYTGVLMSYLYQVRVMPEGRYLVWLIFLSSWGCDTCAYCAGRLFGRHKMAPVLSPKKTVEGAIGGVLGAAILGGIYAAVFGSHMTEVSSPVPVCVIACAAAGLISMVGDLAASGIKRNHEVKDYSHLIPGHGGILDRFDSMLFTAPVIYLAVLILAH